MKQTFGRIMAVLMVPFLLLSMSSCIGGNKPDKVVAKIDDATITQEQLEHYACISTYTLGYDPSQLGKNDRKEMLNVMVDAEVIKQYYDKQSGTIYSDTYDADVDAYVQNLKNTEGTFLSEYSITDDDLKKYYNSQYVTQALFAQIQSEKSNSDVYEEAKTYYDAHMDDFKSEPTVRASLILTDNINTANTAIQQLNSGADFAQLVQSYSIETTSAPNGGDIGYFTEKEMADKYNDSAFKMQVGQISEPIPVDDGYAVLKITERNETGYKSFDEVIQDIYYDLYQGYYNDKLDDLKQSMSITIEKVS